MADGLPPALIVERFDIRDSADDERRIALEDLCSVLGLSPDAKYGGTMERVARVVRSRSTAPEEDLLVVFKCALFAWLIADGDRHLKSLALLEIAEPGDETFRSVRMTPLYDAVTTRVFPGLEHDRMALKLNGKDDNLRRADFRGFARTAGLKAAAADVVIDERRARLADAVDRTALPEGLEHAGAGRKVAERILDLCRSRLKSIA
ncbi:MAG: HipA domain-containing protein [Candidatus Binatia bacterium]